MSAVGARPDPGCDLCSLTASDGDSGAWLLTYLGFDPLVEGRREALLTLANGYQGVRGALSESHADGVHYPGAYVAGCYNRLDSMIDDVRHEDESIVNLPNWVGVTFRIDDGAWFSPVAATPSLTTMWVWTSGAACCCGRRCWSTRRDAGRGCGSVASCRWRTRISGWSTRCCGRRTGPAG